MFKLNLPVSVEGHVLIEDADTGEVLLDKHNAIHSQNMARVLARGLANEDNSIVHRIAFGNGGTFIDAASNTVYRPPNDGTNGEGWESRLYNETYSEIVDEGDPSFGTDPGSAGSDNIRVGGGACPADDPAGGGVVSVEAGTKSNVIVTMYINENEPSGQLDTSTPAPLLEDDERCFLFDEIGLYSAGKPAVSTSGVSSVDVTNKTSENDSGLTGGTLVSVELDVDGVNYNCVLNVPESGTGSGGALTYGDLCEGINNGTWIVNGDPINTYVYVFITDRSNGTYPTITSQQSFGNLTFQSKTNGTSSSVNLVCNDADPTNLFNILTSGVCGNVNVNQEDGENAGLQNDSIDPTNERERLLTHLIFDPILKSADRIIKITYTLTISVASTSDSCFNQTLP